MQKRRLVKAHPVLGTDASFVLSHLLEHVWLIKGLTVRKANVNVQVTVSNVTVAEHKHFSFIT
jgi:hypothetical protein